MSISYTVSRGSAWLVALALGTTGFVVVAVNVLIYWARDLYAFNHPERVASKPATVSQTLADQIIGPFFATWMLICAPILLVGVVSFISAGLIEFRKSGLGTAADMRRIRILTVTVCVLQAMASVGMIMLSHFRFPDHHELHMVGSYLFFFSQAFVIVFGEVLSRSYEKQPDGATFLRGAGARIRRWYVWIPIGLGVGYLTLFILKGYDLGAIYPTVYYTYTLTEPLLISSFLGYLLTYHFDMVMALGGYFRSRSMAPSI
ncbi:MAG: Frag1/DRAM/Sfk1 family protein [Pseudopelagicola sp.]|nr:Frag1/DRAM/Sfk1 family protein [Pseudopelagicola sp.]